jgi:hypothetical protein
MKKHNVAKPRLSRETLRLLANARLQGVAGGEFAGANQGPAPVPRTDAGCA